MLNFLKEKYYIVLIVVFILIISVIGLGYLEIKNLKNKILNIENQLYKNQNDLKKKQQTIEKQPINLCIICNKKNAEPSSMNKYHLKYCIECATIDHKNTIKVEKFIEQQKLENDLKKTIQQKSTIDKQSVDLESQDKTEIYESESILEQSTVKVDKNNISEQNTDEQNTEEQNTDEQNTEEQNIDENSVSRNESIIEQNLTESENLRTQLDEEDLQLIDGFLNTDDKQSESSIESSIESDSLLYVDDPVDFKNISNADTINTPGYQENIENKLKKIKLDILRDLLRKHELPYSGNKTKIISRIIQNKLNINNIIQ
jgi:hypothetical protein